MATGPAGGVRRRRIWFTAAVLAAVAAVTGWFASGEEGWRARAVVRGPQAGGVLAFSHDGATLATWGAGRIALWDADGGRNRAVWEGPGRGVHIGAFAPDGATFLFVARGDYPQPTTVRRVDVATGRPLEPVVMESEVLDRPAALYGLAFTPDGARLRAAFGDRTGVRRVVDWDPATGRALGRRAVSCPVPPGF